MMISLGLGLGVATSQRSANSPLLTDRIALVVVTGASNQAGGDPDGTLTADDSDPTGRVRQFRWSDSTIQPLDGTIFRPGGSDATKTSPAIAFAKAYAATLPSNTNVVIVMSAVGGRGVWGGGLSPGLGPWNPGGLGAPWPIGGTPLQIQENGALYLAQAGIRDAVYAACEAEVGAGNVLEPVFYGAPMNENDAIGPYDVLRDRAARAITGIRAAWGAEGAPWIVPGMVPEWGYAGAVVRYKIDAINKELEERLPYLAYVKGEVGYMSPTENIHYTNPGLRALGARAFAAVAVAVGRTAALGLPVDWLDGLGAVRCWGFYRGPSAYGTGAAFRLHNGTTEVDIAFTPEGVPDWDAALSHAGSGRAHITRMYDHFGNGYLVPEGSHARGAETIDGGEIVFQGRRPSWGNDLNNILLTDAAFGQVAAGAILAVGRFAAGGNKTLVGGPVNSLAMTRAGGNLMARSGATWRTASVVPEAEPAWIGGGTGYNLYSYMAQGEDIHIDGVADVTTLAGSGTYDSPTIAWGGRGLQTNRYAASRHTQLVVWDKAPTGAALNAVNDAMQKMVAEDALYGAK